MKTGGSPDALVRTGVTMMVKGAIAGAIVAFVVTMIGLIIASKGGAFGALAGSLISVLVMVSGQGVLTATSRRPPVRILVIALGIYIVSLVVFIFVIHALYIAVDGFSGLWVSIGAAAGAYGYLTGAIIAYHQARIPVMIPSGNMEDSPSGDTLSPYEGSS